jgi:hypothetical protein
LVAQPEHQLLAGAKIADCTADTSDKLRTSKNLRALLRHRALTPTSFRHAGTDVRFNLLTAA